MSNFFLYAASPHMSGRFYDRTHGLEAIRVMICDIRSALARGEVAHVLIEPGDMTAYEFVIVRLSTGPYTPFLLAIIKPSQTCAFRLDSTYLDLADMYPGINPCTRAVISDVWNRLFGMNADSFPYNWELACPTEAIPVMVQNSTTVPALVRELRRTKTVTEIAALIGKTEEWVLKMEQS